MTETEKEIKEIMGKLDRIVHLLENAGFSSHSPSKMFDITQKAQRDADKIRERLNGNKKIRK